jgi:surfeit locus 1 family protein
LIAEIAARAYAAPQPLPGAGEWPELRLADCDYRNVVARGTFEHAKEALVFHAGPEPGYHVLTPLRLNSGGYVIVNRGFVPAMLKDQVSRPEGQIAGETSITGILRKPEMRNIFTPPDNPAARQYFTNDPNIFAKELGGAPTSPFIIDADASPVPGGWPKGGTTVLALPNNHLAYAFTWFGLAFALFGMFAVFAWQQRLVRGE